MGDCQNPHCTTESDSTYKDEHGNTLDLCERHYYELVSGVLASSFGTSPTGVQFTQTRQQPIGATPTTTSGSGITKLDCDTISGP